MDEEKEKLSESCEIRLLKKEELSTVASIYFEAFNAANIGEKWTQETAEKFMRWWFGHQPDLFFVATHKEQLIAGIVAGVKPWWDGNHLAEGELFVHPDFQKQGVGKRLVRTLLKEAMRSYDIVEFEGLADKGHEFPLSWHRRLGMKETNLVHLAGDPRKILEKLQ